MGFKLGGSIQMDKLTYQYFGNNASNRLQTVTEDPSIGSTDNKLGDFTDKNRTGDDYVYDQNGNMTTDNNKGIANMTYNYLNLPQNIPITGKGNISYIYDASGNKLQKTVSDISVAGKIITTTTNYLSGFTYESKTISPADPDNPNYTNLLQFVPHEEGRIRYIKAVGSVPESFVYDYFIKDHLGNVRMVLTEEHEQNIYPAVTLEGTGPDTDPVAVEQGYYSITLAQVVPKPAGITDYPNNNGNPPVNNNPNCSNTSVIKQTDLSQKVYRTNASNTNRSGLGITLKVMAGDKLDIFGKSYYADMNTGGASSNLPIIVLDILNGMLGTPSSPAAGHATVAQLNANTSGVVNPLTAFITGHDNPAAPTVPRAYINCVFFDEQFNYAGSRISQVGAANAVKSHYGDAAMQNILAPKSGYVYIYLSNESPVDVYFDNLQVIHSRGPLLEETHYYPFGLVMQGISDRALKSNYAENKFKYNGKELQNNEFGDGSGLEAYDFGKRMQDPQIGRWWVLDPKADLLEMSSPYAFCYNNPIAYKDPDGELAILINGKVASESERGSSSYWDEGVISAIEHSGIPYSNNRNNFLYVDGDRWGQYTGATKDQEQFEIHNGTYFSGNEPSGRALAGRETANQDWESILSKLKKDPKSGKIIEKIEIYTHSRGAAFGAGYIDGLLQKIQENSDLFADPSNEIDLVYNMAPHQSWGADDHDGLNAYSHDHSFDPLSGNDMGGLKGAFRSNEGGSLLGQHTTKSFTKDIKAFTKAFVNSNGNSKKLIENFINMMQHEYGVNVTVKQ